METRVFVKYFVRDCSLKSFSNSKLFNCLPLYFRCLFCNIFFSYMNILTGYYQKTKKGFKKRLAKGTKIFLNKEKTKSIIVLVNDTEIVLKKKKKKIVNMVANDIKVF